MMNGFGNWLKIVVSLTLSRWLIGRQILQDISCSHKFKVGCDRILLAVDVVLDIDGYSATSVVSRAIFGGSLVVFEFARS